MGVTSIWTPHKLAVLLLLSINQTLIHCSAYINADKVELITERTLGKGNQFDIELSFENLDGTPCQNCTVCSVMTGVHALYDTNPRTQLCTKCDVSETCHDDYYVHADLIFGDKWPMNYYKLSSSQNGGRDPEEIWLKGTRNNGKKWFELDHQSSLSWTDRKQDKTLTFKNKNYFTKYRLTMRKGTEDNNSGSSNIMELSGYEFASDFLSKFVTDLVYNVVKIQYFQPDIITLYRNFRVGEITEPAKNYEISFVVHPFAATTYLKSLVRFTTNPNYDTSYGSRVPLIAMSKHDSTSGNKGLGLRVFMDSRFKPNQDRYCTSSLELNKNNKIKFVVLGDKASLYVENDIVASFVIPDYERNSFSRLYAYASDNFYEPADAQIKHLVYTPIDVAAESVALKFKPTSMKVTKNVKIGSIIEPHNNFELSFRFNPTATSKSVASILRLTSDSTGSLDTDDGHRIPLIGLFPGSYNLLFSFGSEASNRHWQYPAVLVPKIDNVIKVVVLDDNMALHINGFYAGSMPYPLVNRPFYDKIYVFAADNVLKEASGTLSHVTYKPVHTNTQITRFKYASSITPYNTYYRLGHIEQMPTSEYIISATLFAYPKKSNNGFSIFRFSSKAPAYTNGGDDKSNYGVRSPLLCYKSNSDPKLGMSIISKTESGGIKEQSIGFKSELNQYEETHVTIVSINNKISLYINGELDDSATAPLVERPPFKTLYVFTSYSMQQFFNGVLRQLEYTPLYKSNQILFQPNSSTLRLSRNKHIGTVINPRLTNLYEITFTLRPYNTYSDWTSIIRFTRPNGEDNSKYGDRAPALWFTPSTRRIHLAHGSTEDPIRHFQTFAALSYNQESNIRIISKEDGIISLFVNDQPAGSMYIPLANRPHIDTLNVYVGDSFYPQASADISHLTYRHIYANAGNEFLLSRGFQAKRDNIIGEISNPTSEFVISCIIHPVGVTSDWSNVFRFSRVSPTDNEVYGDRYAALYLQPNSLRPRLMMGTVPNPRSHVPEEPIDFILKKDNDFKLVVSGNCMIKMYINNAVAGTAQYSSIDCPPLEKLMVYVSDSFHEPANVFVRQLKYTPKFTSTSVYKFLHSPITVQRNNLLSVIEYPSPFYTISCTIRPTGVKSDWNSIFRFGRVSLTDADFYGDRSPALLFKPGSYDLFLGQGSTIDPNQNIHVGTKLNQGVDNTVKIVSNEDGQITIYVNGINSGSAYIPLSTRPNIEKLLVYVGDPYYLAANAMVSNLMYEPIIAKEPVVTSTSFSPSVIAISKNNKVGQVVKPSSQYVISSTITPFGTVDGWGCLFRFTKDPESNAENYGDRNPLLMFHSGNYDLHSSVMLIGQNNYNNMYNMKGIIANQDNNVQIVAFGNKVSYYVNDEKVGSMLTPISDRPELDLLHVFASDNFYNAANAQITNLVFSSIISDGPIPFYPNLIAIKKNNKVGEVLPTSKNFRINFLIQPSGIKSGLSSILRFGRTSYKDKDFYGDRAPAFFFSPGTLKLLVAQGSTRDSSHEMQSLSALDANQESKVELITLEDTITLYVNEVKEVSMIVPLANRPLLEELQVHAGDDYYNEANAVIKDLVYTPLQSKIKPIFIKPYELTAVKNYKIGEINEPSSEYIVSFTLHPFGTVSGWSSILAFTSNDSGTYNDRWLGLFFKTGTYKILFHAISTSGLLEMKEVPGIVPNVDNLVTVVARDDRIRLFINSVQAGAVYSPVKNRSPVPKLNIMASAANYGAAKVHIKHLVYTPINRHNPYDLLPTKMKLVQGKKLGDIYNSNSQYIISFGIKPLGIVENTWTNILRFTTDSSSDSGYGVRNPALFFNNGNSFDLQLSQETNAGRIAINSMKGLVLNEETHVKVVAVGHLIKVYFDDIKIGEMYSILSSRPPIDHLQVVCASVDTVANAEISNLVYTPIPYIITDPFYPIELGFCKDRNGYDKDGVDLGDLKTETWAKQQQECKDKCIAEMNKGVFVTGCEANKTGKKCWLHNQPVAKGSGDTNNVCWVAGAPMPFKFEQGRCANKYGNSGSSSYKTYLGATNNNNHCMRKCIEYYDQSTEKENISGCQRDSNKDCYAYHLSSFVASMGNGSSYSMCILKDNVKCSGDKCECGSAAILQDDYRGTISKTVTGQPCQRWDTKSPHNHSYNPKSFGLDGNYCRNPNNEKTKPWCYTTDPSQTWDYCDVPKCPCGTLSKRKEDYRGDIATTTSGRTCQAWNSQTVHAHDRTSPNYPNSGLESNFCRNPGSKSTPWCYTTDPNVPYDACNVPTCDPLYKVRIFVNTLYYVCQYKQDNESGGNDVYVNVYVNGRYCGRTHTHWNVSHAYFSQFFYCGTHNRLTSMRVTFYAYDDDSGTSSDDYLGSLSVISSTKDSNSAAYLSGYCGSNSGLLYYTTHLYL